MKNERYYKSGADQKEVAFDEGDFSEELLGIHWEMIFYGFCALAGVAIGAIILGVFV